MLRKNSQSIESNQLTTHHKESSDSSLGEKLRTITAESTVVASHVVSINQSESDTATSVVATSLPKASANQDHEMSETGLHRIQRHSTRARASEQSLREQFTLISEVGTVSTTPEYSPMSSNSTSSSPSTIRDSLQQPMKGSVYPSKSINLVTVETDINSSTAENVNREQLVDDPNTILLSTRERSSDLSLGKQFETISDNGVAATTIEDSFIMIETSDENDPINKEVALMKEYINETIPNEMVAYEVVSEHHGAPNTSEALHKYPHIFIKLCDGEIINADS